MVESLLARNMSRIFAHDQRDLTLIIVKRTRVWPDDILLVTCDRTRRTDKCTRLGRWLLPPRELPGLLELRVGVESSTEQQTGMGTGRQKTNLERKRGV